MKKYILFIIFTVVYLSQISAQQPTKSKSIYLQGGIVNNGYNINAGFEKLFGGNLNSLFVSLNNQEVSQTVNAADIIINENDIFVNIGYRRYFNRNNTCPLFPYVGLGILCGYQHLGSADNGIYHLSENESFLYGAITHAGIEYFLGKISLLAEGSYMYSGNHYLMANIGIKLYF